MQFNNSFEVPLPPHEAWTVLMDIERIAPCMPGAQLTEVVDDKTYKGKVSVRLGPVSLSFAGVAKFEEVDDVNYRARVKAQGTDAKGRGGASATVAFQLEPIASGTKVLINTDLTLSGSVAQYGRGTGLIQDVASQLIGQFANSLRAQIAQTRTAPVASATSAGAAAPSAPPPPPAAKPISGFSLVLRVLWNAILRLFGIGRTGG